LIYDNVDVTQRERGRDQIGRRKLPIFLQHTAQTRTIASLATQIFIIYFVTKIFREQAARKFLSASNRFIYAYFSILDARLSIQPMGLYLRDDEPYHFRLAVRKVSLKMASYDRVVCPIQIVSYVPLRE